MVWQSRNIKRLLLLHLFYIALIIGITWLYDLTGIGCPIRYLAGMPCPTCGVTRATLSLLRLDFGGYLLYNPAAVPVIVAFWLSFHRRLFKNIVLINGIIISLAVFTLVVYIVRYFV